MTTTAVLRLFTRRRGDLLVVFTAALAAGTVELVLWHISARFSYLPGVLIVLAALHWGGARWGVVATLACLAAGSYVSEMLGSSGMPPAAHWVLAPTFVVIGVVLSVTYRRLRMDDLRRRRERRAFERALRHRDELLRELRESTGRLKRLSESNIVGVIHWNLDTGLITDCNDEFLRMTGYDRTDLTSGRLDFNAMTPPDWRDRNAAGVEALRATGAAQAYEKEYLRKDGTRVPVIIAGARFHDSLREGMSFVLDLSGRRRAEEDLRANERMFRTLADSIAQLAWTARPDGHVFWFNRRWYDYTGLRPDQAEGWNWTRALDPRELPRVLTGVASHFSEGTAWEDSFALRRSDGAMRAHLGRALPVHDAGGNVSMWVGTFTDITGEAQRMRCQAELVQAALHMCGPLAGSVSIGETLQSLLDTGRSVTGAPSVRLVVASHGVLQEPLEFRSPALEGFDADMRPLPEHTGTPPGPQRIADGPMRPSVPEHGDGELQIPLAGSDGRPMGSLAYALPSAGFSQEENTAALQLAAMVTASLEGWRLRQALAEAERQKDTFLAMLAHELRNPLAPLRAGLAILRISEPESDIALQARDMMERQLGHMVRLIDDLMDLERVTQGKIELRKERVELTSALRLAMETCGPAIEEGGHRLRVDVPERPLYVEADITRCSQLLANVLGNAAKFTPRGGVIEVRLARQGAEAVVTVTDTGRGIPAAMLDSIFDMFVQVSPAQDRVNGGLGIGLYLVRRLAELHGGRVTARSEGPGRGSEFEVRLPAAEVFPDAAAMLPAKAHRHCGPRRVIVADDNTDAASSLAILLALRGSDARVASDGFEALRLGETFEPHVVMLDIGMPGLDGFETARRVRAAPWGRDVLLVAITGWGRPDDRAQSQAAGFDLHLVKPVDLDVIESLLTGAPEDVPVRG